MSQADLNSGVLKNNTICDSGIHKHSVRAATEMTVKYVNYLGNGQHMSAIRMLDVLYSDLNSTRHLELFQISASTLIFPSKLILFVFRLVLR